MKLPPEFPPGRGLFAAHPRTFAENRYVYPVLSRRAGGISIGVNINLDKACNFKCIYCQVDRTAAEAEQLVDLDRLMRELEWTAALVTSGEIYQHTPFDSTPAPLRRLSDIALSGDGEPTIYARFDEVVAACAEVRRRLGLDAVKLVLISNASMFHHDRVQRSLEILDATGGEIWAKLDTGTEAYYRRVARSAVPWTQILANLAETARRRPIVIQSLFARIRGEPPPPAEQEAYCQRLGEILAAGGQIKLVQIYTVARAPAESWVTPLSDGEIDSLAALVRCRAGLPVAGFHS